jgi:hypothetical protein
MIDDIETYTTGTSASLGPHYKLSRDFAEKIMSADNESGLSAIIAEATNQFHSKLSEVVQYHVLSDVECNVQGEIWHEVDYIVTAILGGEQWALQRHVLGDRYECAKIRATIAIMIPVELQGKRVTDLDRELTEANRQLEWARRR